MHTNNPIIKHKAGLLNLAEELQNVSKACKIMGVSRDTFYRYQELVETNGLEGLINRERRVQNLKSRVGEGTEQAVISYAIDFPALNIIEMLTRLHSAVALILCNQFCQFK